MQEVVFGIVSTFLGFTILYFVIKYAVKAGIKEANEEKEKDHE